MCSRSIVGVLGIGAVGVIGVWLSGSFSASSFVVVSDLRSGNVVRLGAKQVNGLRSLRQYAHFINSGKLTAKKSVKAEFLEQCQYCECKVWSLPGAQVDTYGPRIRFPVCLLPVLFLVSRVPCN